MLIACACAWAHLEVALLASQLPYDLTALAVNLVDRKGPAGTNEQVGVVIDVYGVDVEVVEDLLREEEAERPPRSLGWLAIGLREADMVEAVPFEEYLAGLYVYLLGNSL